MSVIPNWVILVVVLAVISGIFFTGRHYGVQATELKYANKSLVALEDAAVRERQQRVELESERGRLRDVSQKLQDALKNNGVVYVDVIHNITKEVEKPVYSSCLVPSSGVQLASDNAARFNATRSAKN